jgi:hypothetical protein
MQYTRSSTACLGAELIKPRSKACQTLFVPAQKHCTTKQLLLAVHLPLLQHVTSEKSKAN